MKGICQISIIPCRKEPSDGAEMVNQLLFGETYDVLEEKEKWIKILTHGDNYECWISRNQYTELEKIRDFKFIVNQKFAPAHSKDETIFLTAGAIIEAENAFNVNDQTFVLEQSIVKKGREHLEKTARSFINSPYLWGGKTFMGIDCSGFTQIVFRCLGQAIPRDAWQQEEKGEIVNYGDHTEGDLAFFCNSEEKVTHVGILLSKNEIIHASGKVRIDIFDAQGINKFNTGVRTHQLFSIKRYF